MYKTWLSILKNIENVVGIRRGLCLVVLCLFTLQPRILRAAAAVVDDEARILVVLDGSTQSVAPPLVAELRGLGFVVTAEQRGTAEPLDDAGRRRRAQDADVDAALFLASTTQGVELRVVDRRSDKALLRRVPAGSSPDGIALRAVELLRASLLEVVMPPDPVASAVPVAPAAVRKLTRAPVPPWSILFEGGVTASPGGFSPGAILALEPRWSPLRELAVSTRVSLPVLRNRLDRPEGEVNAYPGHVIVGLNLRLLPAGSRLGAELGAGGGVALVILRARPGPNFSGRDDLQLAFVARGHVAALLAISTRTRLRLGGAVELLQPRSGVRFEGERVGSYGRPAWSALLGIEVSL